MRYRVRGCLSFCARLFTVHVFQFFLCHRWQDFCETVGCLLSSGSLHKCPQQAAASQSQEPGTVWVSHVSGRDPWTWAVSCYFPGYALAGSWIARLKARISGILPITPIWDVGIPDSNLSCYNKCSPYLLWRLLLLERQSHQDRYLYYRLVHSPNAVVDFVTQTLVQLLFSASFMSLHRCDGKPRLRGGIQGPGMVA